MDIFKKNFVIATHYLVYGAPQALREFLINGMVERLLFIAHPLEINSNDRSYFEEIEKGKEARKIIFPFQPKISILNFLKDLLLNLWWVLKDKEKVDIFVGVDNLNAFSGIILKKFGRVKKVIYYTIDYSPVRFKNKLLNLIYHKIDAFCVKHSDVVWNVSPRIAEGRKKIRNIDFQEKQKVVPIGVWLKRVKKRDLKKIKMHQLLFVGHLLEKQGVQKVLIAIPLIVKEIPDFHFLVVGGGEYENILKRKAKQLGIERYVTFTGWIKDRKKLDEIISESACAIAPYDPRKAGFTYYADPTKIKDYLSGGLPVILTNVSYNAEEIEKNKCGVVIKYKKEDIAQAVIKILKNQNMLKRYRDNALRYIEQFDWNKIFDKYLSQI